MSSPIHAPGDLLEPTFAHFDPVLNLTYRADLYMGNYSNNGPSFSGMRTWKPFYFPKRGPKTWFQELKAEFRREDRERAAQRRMKRWAKLQKKRGAQTKGSTKGVRHRLYKPTKPVDPAKLAQLQAEKVRNARINDLMRDVRGEIARKKKREERAVLAAKKAIMAEVRAKNREDRARIKEWLLFRKFREQSRREEEREKKRLNEALRKAENARSKAEKAKRKAEKIHQERMRVRKALAKKADAERVKARARRLQRLLKDIRRKHRK